MKWANVHGTAERNMEKAGFSLFEFHALLNLHDKGRLSMVTFANDLGVTSAAVTGIIDRLESRGFVERTRSKEDRRIVEIEITAKGRKAFHRAKEIHERLIRHLLASLDEEDSERLVAIYSTLEKAASGFEGGPP
jgi:DNA-binding MarR family transcriptional regulator